MLACYFNWDDLEPNFGLGVGGGDGWVGEGAGYMVVLLYYDNSTIPFEILFVY